MEKTNVVAIRQMDTARDRILIAQTNLCNADTEVPHITRTSFDRIFWAAVRALPDPSGCRIRLFLEDGREVHYGEHKCFIY